MKASGSRVFVPLVLSGVLLLLGASAAPARAAQVCALRDLAVFERDGAGCHALDAVSVDGKKRPIIVGRICMKKQSTALHQLLRHGKYIVALLWNEVEIYDFENPRRPSLVRSFTLDETHAGWGGGGVLRQGDTLVVLGTTVSAELTMAGPPADWRVRNLDVTSELKRRTEGLYTAESREMDPADPYAHGGAPRVVPLEGGRFEVRWTVTRPGPGLIRHRQYLRVVESGAALAIDVQEETID